MCRGMPTRQCSSSNRPKSDARWPADSREPLTSSINPTKNTNAAAESNTITLSRISRNASPMTSDRKSAPTARHIVERNIAMPPMCVVGFVCTCRGPGVSVILNRRASQITVGVITNVSKVEPAYTKIDRFSYLFLSCFLEFYSSRILDYSPLPRADSVPVGAPDDVLCLVGLHLSAFILSAVTSQYFKALLFFSMVQFRQD